jgi:hypothetical protein
VHELTMLGREREAVTLTRTQERNARRVAEHEKSGSAPRPRYGAAARSTAPAPAANRRGVRSAGGAHRSRRPGWGAALTASQGPGQGCAHRTSRRASPKPRERCRHETRPSRCAVSPCSAAIPSAGSAGTPRVRDCPVRTAPQGSGGALAAWVHGDPLGAMFGRLPDT